MDTQHTIWPLLRHIKDIIIPIVDGGNAPSALLSYISMREFLKTREKCGEVRLLALLECS